MPKRLFALLAAASLAAAACGGDDNDSDAPEDQPTQTPSATDDSDSRSEDTASANESSPEAATEEATSADPAPDESEELTPIVLQVQPLIDYSPVYLGIEKGLFAAEGLDVETVLGQGGAAAIPAIVSGEAQIAGSNVVSVMMAFSQGLDIRITAPGVNANREYSAVVVPGDSDIQTPADLAGRTLSVNTLGNIGEVTIRAAMSDQVDVDSIKLTELGFGDMLPALDQDQIDAAWVVEPFVTAALADGARVISYNFEETEPELQVAVFVSTAEWAEANPDLVARFNRALVASIEYSLAHEDELRAILPTFARIDEAVATDLPLPIWQHRTDRQSVEAMGARMVEYGLLPEEPDYSTLFSVEDALHAG